MGVSLPAIFILLVTILTFGWRILNWLWVTPKYLERRLREQGLAGNSYRLLSGDLKDSSLMSNQAISKPITFSDDISPRVVPFFHHTVKTYGKKCFMWVGPKPSVFIMDPEQIKDILTKTSLFRKPRINPLARLLVLGVVAYEGEKWAKHRKIINPAFRIEKLKDMLHAFYQSSNDMISQWERLIGEEGSCELDVWPYIENLSGDVISRSAFGSSYTEGKRIFQLQKEQAELFVKAGQSVYIPGWRFLPTNLNKRMKEISREVGTLLKEIIDKRERERKAGNAANDDLLGVLMESNSRELQESGNEKNAAMSIADVIEECKLFYFAGQETTSVLLVWTMIMLSKYPNWQVRAREEVLQVFGKNKPDFDGLNHLKVVTMILLEVLRFYPPVTWMNRSVDKETKLGNLTIPAGVLIALPTILVQRDCELWGDNAKEFDPERFSEGVSKATRGQLSFFPFGGGPRICIGQNFAMMEAKMALTLILQHFSFELSSSYTHAPFTIITLQPQFGAHIILHKL
ncbi:cytochrome P450 CYP72A219-like isoform X1 [Alnus glutinosa]|uniref:cytochrome P450 CYP72A219-like isoform X1 n=3 Tax=Alnus glutinosa TaxID=3517 RepID=UPI002D76C060|nr:cytochrome P450 CYP72A219-like isoform X1 [Alnus glutinosa]